MDQFAIPKQTLKALNAIRTPIDYFGDTRTTDKIWPHHILCFTRKSRQETAAEPLSRNHHHRYVLVIPCKGNGKVLIDSRQFSLKCSEALLIFPFQFHHGYKFDRDQVLWLYLTFELDNGNSLDAIRLNPIRKLKKQDFAVAWHLVEAWSKKTKRQELAYWLGILLARLLCATGQHFPGGKKESGRVYHSSNLLLRINHYCMSHLQSSVTLSELSQQLGVSQSHMRALFRAETGISLGQHLRRLRLQKAMGLLVQSELSITQIAEQCGFDSIFSFSRSFRRFSGMMAKEYRKRFFRI